MQHIITLLIAYRYLILIPFAIIEGPILTVIAGFLVSLGALNWFIVYAIVVWGDVVGDTLCWCAGHWGAGWLHRHGHYIGITSERLSRAKEYFETYHLKAIILSKLVHGIGFAGLMTAGSLRIPYVRFIKTCLTITLIQSAILLAIGIFFGHAYLQIGSDLNYFAAAISGAAVTIGIGAIAYRYIRRAALKRVKNK